MKRQALQSSLLPGAGNMAIGLIAGSVLVLLLCCMDEPLRFLALAAALLSAGFLLWALVRQRTSPLPLCLILAAMLLGRTAVPLGSRTLLIGAFEIALLVSLMVVAVRYLRSDVRVNASGLDLAVVLFFFAHLPQVAKAADLPRYAAGLWVLGAGIVFYGLARHYLGGTRDAVAFLSFVPVWTGLLGLLVLMDAASHPYGLLYAVKNKTVELAWGRSNYLAAFLVMGAPLAFAFFSLARDVRWRLLYLACACLSMTGIIVTGSRGGFLALIAILSLQVLYRLRGSGRTGALSVVLVAALILFLLWPVLEVQRSGYVDIPNKASGRYEIWRGALALFLRSPVLGQGILNASDYSIPNAPEVLRAHNFFLETLMSAGLIGGAGLLFLLFQIRRTLRRAEDNAFQPGDAVVLRGAGLALLGAFLHGLVEINLYGIEFGVVFFGVLGAVACMERSGHEE